jgi:hypothetical protein
MPKFPNWPGELKLSNRLVLRALAVALLIGAGGVTSGVVQSASTAVVDWWVMASGGAPSATSRVTVNATLGQPITGLTASWSGQTVLKAGYWSGQGVLSVTRYQVFLPMIQQP